MKQTLLILAVVAAGFSLAFMPFQKESIAIGAKAPKQDLKMKHVSGNSLTLREISQKNGLLVIFSCNTCPFVVGRKSKDVEGWQGRYNGIYKEAQGNDIGMVMVNSNAAKRDNGDSYNDMVSHYKKNKLKGYYVLDSNSELANAFGAKTTPHVFLFDNEMRLVYKGAIDDNHAKAKDVKEHWLSDAMNNLVGKKPITTNKTKAIGCSIKRVQTN